METSRSDFDTVETKVGDPPEEALILPLVTALAASGATLGVTVAYESDGPRLLGAVRLEGRGGTGPPGGDLEVVDADGQVVATAAIPDPRVRSVIGPDGGGETAVLPTGI